MKSLRIKARRGGALSEVVKYIFQEKPELPDKASTFDLIEGPKTEGGSGDNAIVEIVIRYASPDEADLEDIRDIIAIASASADKTDISITQTDE